MGARGGGLDRIVGVMVVTTVLLIKLAIVAAIFGWI